MTFITLIYIEQGAIMVVHAFITKETWPTEEVGDADEDALHGYAKSIQFLLPHLKRISEIEDFAQMKEELTKLITEREEFMKFAYDRIFPFIPRSPESS